MWAAEYKDCLEYIDNYWKAIIYKPSRMKLRYRITNLPYEFPYAEKLTIGNKNTVEKKDISPSFIKLPHYYFVPNDNKFTFIYYWDSYFMFRGLLGTRREWLMREMVENFMYLFNTFHIIPNFSAPASMGRSQPPFFTSMILDAYLTPLHTANPHKQLNGMARRLYQLSNRSWLKRAMQVAKLEYALVWIDPEKVFNHSVDGFNLSRYGDRDIGYAHSSELESGWDMTSRFFNRCDQFLPIDLNSYLYKYERDFATMAEILNKHEEKEYWLQKAEDRKYEINKYMWDDESGFFYDYGYTFNRTSDFLSLASYAPMWAGYATYAQAKRMVDKLSKFETEYGLTITAKESLARHIDLSKIQRRYHAAILEIINPKQWDYPNIWSPLEYVTVIGLLRYGFTKEAKRIMTKSVKAHAAAFRKHATFFEKLNGETGESGSRASYVDQKGFGWTNAVFYRYIQILDAMDSQQSIYNEDASATPPYTLSILH